MTGVRTAHGDGQRYRLLEFMRSFREQNGYEPTIADMAEALDMQRTAVIWHLSKLREEGAITYVDGHLARSLRLVST